MKPKKKQKHEEDTDQKAPDQIPEEAQDILDTVFVDDPQNPNSSAFTFTIRDGKLYFSLGHIKNKEDHP